MFIPQSLALVNRIGHQSLTPKYIEIGLLNPDRDTFEFDQGHVTKNEPITMLVLLSESLAIYNNITY